jgi:hypothetical protein
VKFKIWTTIKMKTKNALTFLLWVAFVILAITSSKVQARDLRIDRAVHNAIWYGGWKQNVVDDIEYRFGAAPEGTYVNLSPPVAVTSYARPYILSQGRSFPREDGPTCDEALRNALLDLAQQARKRGAHSVVNITSNYLESPLNSSTHFACNSGVTSAVVELIAQFATFKVAPVPQTAKRTKPDLRIFPPSSKFAAIDDFEAIPYIGANCKKIYAERFLRFSFPRAFAISPVGRCSFTSGYFAPDPGHPQDPAARALAVCRTAAGAECQLYAVDNTVVFKHSGLTEAELMPSVATE